MATSSSLPSPSSQTGYPSDAELFSLDFMALAGMDTNIDGLETSSTGTPTAGHPESNHLNGSSIPNQHETWHESPSDPKYSNQPEPGPGPSTTSHRSASRTPVASTPNSRRNSLIEAEIVNNLAANGNASGIAAALALARNTSGKGKPRGRSSKRSLKDIPIDNGRKDSPLGQRYELDPTTPTGSNGMEGGFLDGSNSQNQLLEPQLLLQYQEMMAGMNMDQLAAMARISASGNAENGNGSSNAIGNESGGNGAEGIEALMGSLQGMDQMGMNFSSDSGFDAVQAGMLQQQLEHIHMQSPVVFDPHNPQSPYHPMAQMYLTSPSNQNDQQQNEAQAEQEGGEKSKWRSNGMGLLTPGPSGEMFPEMRNEMMSPMQLEMLARESMDSSNDFNVIPLLSPALTNHNNSTYTSPANHAAFNSMHQNGQLQNQMQDQNGGQFAQNNQKLEQLRLQQRQFQEQLQFLQQQQRQMAATAAAVAAASVSPYMMANNGTGQSRPATTPGVNGPGGGSINTPSPGYFSPLTSPALGPDPNRGQGQFNHHQHTAYSPGVNHHRPHPLSALSSPALNPVGSSGGAQQTLSPALGPQSGADLADPEYIRQLVGYMDGTSSDPAQIQALAQAHINAQQAQQNAYNQQYYGSPVIPTDGRMSNLTSPALGATTGPHRSSLPAKSRPSPMMKPTHRSHTRHPSLNSGLPSPSLAGVSGTLTPHLSSPLAYNKFHPTVPGMGFLPPAAIDQRGVAQHQRSLQSGANSVSSTPSPVDLAQMMPPPPVPSSSSTKQKGMTPMTPASLMNLGGGRERSDSASSNQALPNGSGNGKRLAAKTSANGSAGYGASSISGSSARVGKKIGAGNGSPAFGPVGKKTGGRVVMAQTAGAAGSKRNIAARPSGGVGVRAAATKAAAAAAAAAASQPEPENRRTSHKAAEQKRRDSLKAGFDELRLLLPPINTEALDPESGEPIPGSSAPRLLPKSSLVPDDNPNRGVSKVALLKYSNEYIGKLHEKVGKRDWYIDKLREEISRLRNGEEGEVCGEEGEDLLDMDMLIGEEEDEVADEEGGDDDLDGLEDDDEDQDGMGFDLDTVDEEGDADMGEDEGGNGGRRRRKSGKGRKPTLARSGSSSHSSRNGKRD